MVDANQKWEVQESIDWMTKLAPYKPLWIEEPTNPDDIMGHAAIAKVQHLTTRESCLITVIPSYKATPITKATLLLSGHAYT